MDLKPIGNGGSNHDALGDLEIMEPLCAVFRRSLRDAGQKYTPERAQILDAILEIDGLFEADQLQTMLRDKGFRVSKATVYRTIKLLQEAQIIRQVLFDSELAHYQLAYGNQPSDLVVRLDTNEVVTINVPELSEIRDRICADLGLVPRGHRFQIYATDRASDSGDDA
ncbi:MAG: transcriptional repressor [Planctomycetota bacterium]